MWWIIGIGIVLALFVYIPCRIGLGIFKNIIEFIYEVIANVFIDLGMKDSMAIKGAKAFVSAVGIIIILIIFS